MQPLAYRCRRAVSHYGVRGAAHRVLGRAVMAESHFWLELDVTRPRPKPALAPGVTLRRAGEDDLPLLEELPTVSPAEGAKRMRDGNELWLALEDERPLFSCWIFRQHAPAVAAPGGQVPLPPATVCIEDSVTAAAARGRGIAPAAWAAIADALAEEGQHRLITKVAAENIPPRRAAEKVGFVTIASMHFRRLGPRRRTSVELLNGDSGGFLVSGLGARQLESSSQA